MRDKCAFDLGVRMWASVRLNINILAGVAGEEL